MCNEMSRLEKCLPGECRECVCAGAYCQITVGCEYIIVVLSPVRQWGLYLGMLFQCIGLPCDVSSISCVIQLYCRSLQLYRITSFDFYYKHIVDFKICVCLIS